MDETVKLAQRLWSGVDPVGRRTSPPVAFFVGLFTGGIGLAVYFRSLVDFIVPMVVTIALVAFARDPGLVLGAMLAGSYGYFRSAESTARRLAAATA